MRAIFGISGVLVMLGVIVWLMGAPGGELDQAKKVLDVKKNVEEPVSHITGKDAGGGKVMDAASFEILTSNGKPASAQVMSVVPDGSYEKYFGLRKGDIITAIESQGLKTPIRELDNNVEIVREKMFEAFRYSGKLTIKRDGKEMTLPAAAEPAASPTPTNTPTEAPGQPRNSVQNQLDQIRNMQR